MSFLKQVRDWFDSLRGKGPAAAVALTLDLAEARDNKPYSLEAGGLLVERCDGDLYARLNGPNGDGINLQHARFILFPITSLFLTNTAQAGKSARILLLPTGVEADAPAADLLSGIRYAVDYHGAFLSGVKTAKIINLTATGVIHTPASDKKIRLKGFVWSSNADIVTALRFGAGGNLLFAIQAKGVVGMNLVGCNIEGAVNEALYGYLSAAGTMRGTVLLEEV